MADQKKYSNKLAGARCLIIGGTSGIGFATAEALVEAGATVVVSSSKPKRVETAIERLQNAYPSRKAHISGHPCDLADEAKLDDNIKALLNAATDNGAKKLDHVVNTAGRLPQPSGVDGLTVESLKQFGVERHYSVLILSKHLAAYMTAGPAASLTLTSGTVGERPHPGMVAMTGWASGLFGITRGLAVELKPIRVNLIAPGAVKTELWDSLPSEAVDTILQNLSTKLPTGQIGNVEDVAEAYLYAIRDYNLTGTIISTNGGALLME